jgi:RimJ/RimL family protein N-acetyltransferase
VIRTHHNPTGSATYLPETVTAEWRSGLPVLSGNGVTLRELRACDAESLHAQLTTREVSRFISPPPTTVAGFERFIAWTQAERAAGRYVCYAVVPDGSDTAVGLFQIRQLEPSFHVAEWGFALGQSHWGTGLFAAAALRVIDFALHTIGVRRLEARSSVLNGRGNGALRKVGAVHEAVLRKSFLKDDIYHDQILWAINRADWPFRGTSDSLVH